MNSFGIIRQNSEKATAVQQNTLFTDTVSAEAIPPGNQPNYHIEVIMNKTEVLYGAAYYDEYMPVDRLETDMQMMVKAGINVIRIAESTWSSEETSEGVFDFSHVQRTIEAAERHGLYVIIGTPTYAIPPWLYAKCPEVIAVTEQGPGKYGARQIMDITHPVYLFHAERVIRKLMEAVMPYRNVIGFQLDNETKHYHTSGKNVHQRFVKWLQKRFGSIDAVNEAFGFAYWSNRVDSWEHLPDATGSINGSYRSAFDEFRRELVTEFLLWQRGIVDEYRREDQFVTHNFDFEWRGYSFGIQPDVDHDKASKAVTLAGCDIYHPTQDYLTGKEITFGGSLTRCLKNNNYLILETQVQGFPDWTPFDGQLRLQAFSHLSNGANGVMYWHWHSIHNSFETYWKGILSHDLKENREYREVASIGNDLKRIGHKLVNLKKHNRTALLVDNRSFTAMSSRPQFPLPGEKLNYNDVVRAYADALYSLNVEYDVIFAESADYSSYDLLVVPALYCASETVLKKMKAFVKNGGTLLSAIKCGFSDENNKVYHDAQPHDMTDCFGMTYQEFTVPGTTVLSASEDFSEADGLSNQGSIHTWMELLQPGEAEVLVQYSHPSWGKYAAVTRNHFGNGTAIYAGCLMNEDWTKALLLHALNEAGISSENRDLYPVVVKTGRNDEGKMIRYYLNYSSEEKKVPYRYNDGVELLSEKQLHRNDAIVLEPWGAAIVEI